MVPPPASTTDHATGQSALNSCVAPGASVTDGGSMCSAAVPPGIVPPDPPVAVDDGPSCSDERPHATAHNSNTHPPMRMTGQYVAVAAG